MGRASNRKRERTIPASYVSGVKQILAETGLGSLPQESLGFLNEETDGDSFLIQMLHRYEDEGIIHWTGNAEECFTLTYGKKHAIYPGWERTEKGKTVLTNFDDSGDVR